MNQSKVIHYPLCHFRHYFLGTFRPQCSCTFVNRLLYYGSSFGSVWFAHFEQFYVPKMLFIHFLRIIFAQARTQRYQTLLTQHHKTNIASKDKTDLVVTKNHFSLCLHMVFSSVFFFSSCRLLSFRSVQMLRIRMMCICLLLAFDIYVYLFCVFVCFYPTLFAPSIYYI